MPDPVVHEIGVALSVAQHGGKHPAAKPWSGAGPGILEIVSDFDGNTFRSAYTVRFPRAIYVLHCFQKSPRGIKTAKLDVDLIAKRLRAAGADHEAGYGKAGQ